MSTTSRLRYEARVCQARKLWVDGLLSGRFVQSHGGLGGDGNRRCCLGVAADVLPRCGDRRRIGTGGYLSESTLRRLGISGPDQQQLATLNDQHVSFAEIAGVIEHLPIDPPTEA